MNFPFFQQLQIKRLVFCCVVTSLLVACQPVQTATIPTPTIQVDCQTLWEQEKTDEIADLAFSLILEKSQYKPDELVFSTLVLKNIGSVPIWVNNRMLVNHDFIDEVGEVYFVIITPWGEPALLAAMINAGESEAEYFALLQPNEAVESRSEGIMYYGYLLSGKERSNYPPYFVEGKYCVWAVYHNQTDPALDGIVWKGKIKSNYVEFEVIK